MPHAPKVYEYYEFVRWIATPSLLRKLKTQNDFQHEHKVSGQTLANWKRDPNFWEDVRREIREWTKDKTPDVVASLLFEAIKGNTTAQKLWLEMFERELLPKEGSEDDVIPQTFFEIMKLRHDKRLQTKHTRDGAANRPDISPS